MTRRKVLVVEDDAAIRRGLCDSLTFAGYAVLECADGLEARRLAVAAELDLVLLDLVLPGASGLQVLEELVAQQVDQPVVMLTGHGTIELCRRAFKAGAAEFLEKPVEDDLLLETLHACVRRHVRIRQEHREDRDAQARFALLSERERQVLGLIVSGLTNKEAGRALALSPRTVETHRANLFVKLQVDSLAQLIRRYARLADRYAP